jgi:hypothetical protein
MGRKTGYYWVVYDDEWEVALWKEAQGLWYLFDCPVAAQESELNEINENRILPPQ